jgi:glutaredoxin
LSSDVKSRITRAELIPLALVMALAFGLGQWIRGGQAPATDQQGEQLRAVVKPGQLQMISSTTCAYCTKARQWLTAQRVPFEECFVETNAACRQRWVQTGAKATPTFVVGQDAVLGLDAARLLELISHTQQGQ